MSEGITYDDIVRAYQQVENAPPPLTEIKLTRLQKERLLAHPSVQRIGDPPAQPLAGAHLYGVPIRIVEDVHESTPYVEGWDWR